MIKKLANLNIHNAVGPDNFLNWSLRDICSIVAGPIAAKVNTLRQRLGPQPWKETDVCAILKVSHTYTIENVLHPISLTLVISKVVKDFVDS